MLQDFSVPCVIILVYCLVVLVHHVVALVHHVVVLVHFFVFKGTVQQILTGVNTMLN